MTALQAAPEFPTEHARVAFAQGRQTTNADDVEIHIDPAIFV